MDAPFASINSATNHSIQSSRMLFLAEETMSHHPSDIFPTEFSTQFIRLAVVGITIFLQVQMLCNEAWSHILELKYALCPPWDFYDDNLHSPFKFSLQVLDVKWFRVAYSVSFVCRFLSFELRLEFRIVLSPFGSFWKWIKGSEAQTIWNASQISRNIIALKMDAWSTDH